MIGVLLRRVSIFVLLLISTNIYSQANQVTAADTAFYQYLGKTPSELGNIVIGITNLLSKDYWDAQSNAQLKAIIDKVAQMDTINHNPNFTFAGVRREQYYDIISFFPAPASRFQREAARFVHQLCVFHDKPLHSYPKPYGSFLPSSFFRFRLQIFQPLPHLVDLRD